VSVSEIGNWNANNLGVLVAWLGRSIMRGRCKGFAKRRLLLNIRKRVERRRRIEGTKRVLAKAAIIAICVEKD